MFSFTLHAILGMSATENIDFSDNIFYLLNGVTVDWPEPLFETTKDRGT